MPAIRLSDFGGMLPGRSDFLLPDAAAAYARNVWLYRGELRGYRQPAPVHTCASPTAKTVFRIPASNDPAPNFAASTWMEFEEEFVTVLRASVIADSFKRYYIFSPKEAPTYSTLARIKAGDKPFLLGVPVPEEAPTVSYVGGDITILESRAYVYTWVSEFGEEGAPSPATVVTGTSTGTWTIGLTPPTSDDLARRSLEKIYLYRSVTNTPSAAARTTLRAKPARLDAPLPDAVPKSLATLRNFLYSVAWLLVGFAPLLDGLFARFA